MELKSILRPSNSVELTVKTNDDTDDLHFKTLITQGYENDRFVIMAPILHGTVYPMHVNDSLEVIFHSTDNSQALYSIKCQVIERKIVDQLSLLTLRIVGVPNKVQRRDAFRVKVFNTYSYKWQGVKRELVSKDISFTGMLALTNIKLPTGSTIEIIFDANVEDANDEDDHDPDKQFTVQCRVIDATHEPDIRRYATRLIFENLSDTETKYILQYLYSKQAEILHAQPSYEKFLDKAFPKDRRHQEDPVMRRVQLIGLLSLFISFISFVLLLYAQPASLYTLDLFFGYYRPAVWQTNYLLLTFVSLGVGIILGGIGLLLNAKRLKRKNDSLNLGIVLSLTVNILMLSISIYFTLAYDLVLF